MRIQPLILSITLIFLPFAAPFIKLVERLLPGSDGVISRKPIYLDVNMLKTPSIAMTLAGKEVVRMGTMARHNVELSIAAMEDMDSRKIAYVLEHEPVIDALEEEVTKYLTQMSETQMSRELSAGIQVFYMPVTILSVLVIMVKL